MLTDVICENENVDRARRGSYTMADFEINGLDSVDSAINNGH